MDQSYQIADISGQCVHEIDKLQKTLKEKTNQEIVLIAYTPSEKQDQSSKEERPDTKI